jgi:glycine dehydrogenase subunit 2
VSSLRHKAAPGGKASSAPLLGHDEEPTIFDFSVPGRRSASFRTTGVPEWGAAELLPAEELRAEPRSEISASSGRAR